ncbi:hypothetical protein GR200_16375 [Rhizobium leguminosarum]|nr:hypothetical protein [Rhizobium leguminosarum]NEI85477.1 hypothetical protein [Rhizobium leguminosarum]
MCCRFPAARLVQRHGIGRLPDVDGDSPVKKKFKNYPIDRGCRALRSLDD